MVKMRIDSGVASTSQSPKKPEEEIPIGNRSGKPSQLLLGKPWLSLKESLRGNPKDLGTPRKLKTKTEMMCWICHVTSTPRKMKRVSSFTRNIPLDSVGS